MKDFTKLALVGIAGYLIGFYECKYKAQTALMKAVFEMGVEDAQK